MCLTNGRWLCSRRRQRPHGATRAGAPFLLPAHTAVLPGPEGAGKSQVAQTIAYDVALAGHRALYLSGEVTHDEFQSRALKISTTRDGELTDAAGDVWRTRVAYCDTDDALPMILAAPQAWEVVCADFTLVVLDAVSDAAVATGLDFIRDTGDYLRFYSAFVHPCHGRTALLMLDNIGHAEDAQNRAIGSRAKGQKVDIKLSSKARTNPSSLVIKCEKIRATRAPFKKGWKWVAYEHDCAAPVPFPEAMEREREERDAPDLLPVVVAALRKDSPMGVGRLERAARDAGVKARSIALRDQFKAMADDLDRPVIDTGQGSRNRSPLWA